MRTFERYVNRKKITDVKKYLVGRGLTSDEAVRDWCLSQDIEPPSANYFSPGESIQVEKNSPPTKSAPRTTAPESSDPEVWHVPAAERPLRKSSKAGKKATRSTTRKKSTSK